MRFTIDVDDHDPLCAPIQALTKRTQDAQRAAQARFESLPEHLTDKHDRPVVSTAEDVLKHALRSGATATALDRPYNTVLAVRAKEYGKQYKKGERVKIGAASLPIGLEILAMVASPKDGAHWDVLNLTFGLMNVVNPQGMLGGVPLSDLLYTTPKDLLSMFAGTQTKVDVQVAGDFICKTDGATLDGIRIFGWQEEQIHAIQLRIEPVHQHDALADAMAKTRYRKVGDDRNKAWVVALLTEHHALMRPEGDPDYYKVEDVLLAEGKLLRVVSTRTHRVASGVADRIRLSLDYAYPDTMPYGKNTPISLAVQAGYRSDNQFAQFVGTQPLLAPTKAPTASNAFVPIDDPRPTRDEVMNYMSYAPQR